MFKVLVIALFPVLASASWSARALKAADNFGYFPGPQSLPAETRGAMGTIWGGGMRGVRFNESLSNDEHKISLPKFFEKELRVFLRKADGRAPLIVVVPGVFANGNDPLARESTKLFSKLGYHVLTMPNCWSKDFAKAKPIFKEEYPGGEASVVDEVTRWAIHEIGASQVSSVQLFGESLGALTASVVYARDSQRAVRLYDGGATLTWPPIALHSAVTLLDQQIVATDALYKNTCHNLIRRLKTKWRILRGKYILDPTPDEIQCAPAVVVHYAFSEELVKLAKAINKAQNLGKSVPDEMTFAQFIHDFAPRYKAALSETDQYGSLKYWLSQTSPAAMRDIRVLSSEDDFLNTTESWDSPGLLGSPSTSNDSLIVAHWGGHIGLSDTHAYEELIDAQFDLH